MQVRELKKLLDFLPDECDVYVETLNSKRMLLTVHWDGGKYVYLRDHYVHREPKVIRSFDGQEYEVLWP